MSGQNIKTRAVMKSCSLGYRKFLKTPKLSLLFTLFLLSEEISSQSREDDDDDNDNEEEEEKEKEEEEQQRRRRRRRKIKKLEHASGARSVKVKTGQAGESNTDRPGLDATVEGGGEQLSKNKRRKLKKKRHREKLISMGLVPRAAALEFTYQREGDVEEEEEDEEVLERRSLEVSEFLKTTLGFYVSERKFHSRSQCPVVL